MSTAMEISEKRKRWFWNKVDKSPGLGVGDCWLWTGYTESSGYGRVLIEGTKKRIGVHRFAYIAAYGSISRELFVCHRCDTPACCRPDHLFLGTQLDNMRDKIAKGRMGNPAPINPRKGIAVPWSRLKDEDILVIRQMIRDGMAQTQIAKQFNVDPCTICDIKKGRTWKHV